MSKQKATEKIKLIAACVINGKKCAKGATVSVSPSDYNYLCAAGLGEDPKASSDKASK